MKPFPFDYEQATSVDHAVQALQHYGDEAKVLAGGQSLSAMMNFRLARPSVLIDINPVDELAYVRRDGPALRIGALTRHRTLETLTGPDADGYGLLARAARWIGHYPIRTRGTFGGSMAHADPSAEWCLLATLWDASVVVVGPGLKRRQIAATEWFVAPFVSVLEPDELLVEVVLPRPLQHSAFAEYARRRGDFGIVMAAVAFDVVDGVCAKARVALGGIAGRPLRLLELELELNGRVADSVTWSFAGRRAAQLCAPRSDNFASSDYRRRLVATLVERAFVEAA